MIAALALALPGLAQLQPASHESPSGLWRLRVDPVERTGASGADYAMTLDGTPVWEARHPFTLWEACVTDQGRVGGVAYVGQGVSFYGHLQGGGIADFNYWFSVLTGNGRGATINDDKHLMYETRLQWNFTGRELEMTASDIDYHEELTGLVAIGAVTNRSPYTRFSQSGGGELEGFTEGVPGQYRVNQMVGETALMLKGFSWQQEFHWKQIQDEVNRTTTNLLGNYAQAGYFFHYLWEWVPKPLELAIRHAIYSPDLSTPDNLEQEAALASNWFFKGHLNKLTMEVTYFKYSDEALNQEDGLRFRVQWEISF
jgi:hypothetical protein